MKKLIFLFPILLVSCAEYKAMMAEEAANNKNEKVYFSDNQHEIITVRINNVDHDMFFDTGAGATVVYHPKFEVDQKKKIRERSVYGFDKKTKVSTFNYSAESMETGMFSVKNKFLYVTQAKKSTCDSIGSFDGILGSFYESDLMLELNYEKGYLQFLEHFQKEGWTEVEAKFNDVTGKIYVQIEVNGVKDFFIFDTGNKTMTLLNKEVFRQSSNELYKIEMLGNAVGNSRVNMVIDIYSGNFKLDNLVFENFYGIDQSSQRSILNKSFIEKFNWVFDKKNGKAYCIPINREKLLAKKEMSEKTNRLLSTAIDQRLLISYKNFDSTFQLGSQIISVNGENVTPENICRNMELLNRTVNWEDLGVVTLSSDK